LFLDGFSPRREGLCLQLSAWILFLMRMLCMTRHEGDVVFIATSNPSISFVNKDL